MANPSYNLLKRNFVLKRIGKELFLPCRTPIGCEAPPYVPGTEYVYCEVTGFDLATGAVSLNNQTDYTPRNASSYATSVRINSDAIIAAGVKSFKIYYGGSHWLGTPSYEREVPEHINEGTVSPTRPSIPGDGSASELSGTPKPQPFSINEIIQIAFSDLTFDKGVIRFILFVDTRLGEVSFDIPHPTSLKEYDAIKEYFGKVLRKRTVACQIFIEAAEGKILSKSARFVPDDPFDFTVIELVGDYIVRETILNNDEAVSIVEEKLRLVAGLDDKHRNFEGLLETLSKFKKSKHYYHLRHLSSLHEAGAFRLRMTGKPLSFIFVIRGTRHYYLVWETYETKEATYIWELESHDGQPKRKQMEDLVEKIKWLREGNKSNYLLTPSATFKRIQHDYSQTDGGIQKWKTILATFIN